MYKQNLTVHLNILRKWSCKLQKKKKFREEAIWKINSWRHQTNREAKDAFSFFLLFKNNQKMWEDVNHQYNTHMYGKKLMNTKQRITWIGKHGFLFLLFKGNSCFKGRDVGFHGVKKELHVNLWLWPSVKHLISHTSGKVTAAWLLPTVTFADIFSSEKIHKFTLVHCNVTSHVQIPSKLAKDPHSRSVGPIISTFKQNKVDLQVVQSYYGDSNA